MNRSKRIFYYDVLRAIAIIGIVFCHSSVSFVLTGISSSSFYISAFFDCFRDFSIPIFVMLSGALLIGKKDSFVDFFKKRLSRIFIPFIFWVVIYSVYSAVFLIHRFDLSNAVDIFFGTASTLGVTFWFIWMIIICYAVIFIINRIIVKGNERIDNFDKKFILILTVLALLELVRAQYFYFSSVFEYYIHFMIYIIIGYFIATNDYVGSRIDENKIIIVSSALSVALYFYYIFCYVVPRSVSNHHFTYLGYFTFLLLIMSLNIFTAFKYLSKKDFFKNMESNGLGKAITTVSRYSFSIYLSHYLILNALKINIIKIVNFNSQSPLLWIPLFVILTLGISLVITWVLSKIPYLNKVSGIS